MTTNNAPKFVILFICVTLIALTSCADRERLNCPPTKNKALTAVTETTTKPTTPPQYANGAKCR